MSESGDFAIRLDAVWHTGGSGKTQTFLDLLYHELAHWGPTRFWALPPVERAVQEALARMNFFKPYARGLRVLRLLLAGVLLATAVVCKRRVVLPVLVRQGWLSQPDVPRGPNAQWPLVVRDGGGRLGLRTPRGGVFAV